MKNRKRGNDIMELRQIHIEHVLPFIYQSVLFIVGRTSHTKFGTCCSNGQVTAHFLLPHHVPVCGHRFDTEDGLHRPQKPAETCYTGMYDTPALHPPLPESAFLVDRTDNVQFG